MSLAGLSTSRKADRNKIAARIQHMCKAHGVSFERQDETDAIKLDLNVRDQVRCRLEIEAGKNSFILPWNLPVGRGDARRLSQDVFAGQVNTHHGQKATIFCEDAETLRTHLLEVFCAAGEGRMFQSETPACDNIDGEIPGVGALYRVPVTVDVTMTAFVLARGDSPDAAIEAARRFAAEGGAKFNVDDGNYRGIADHYVGDADAVQEVADPADIEQVGVGSVIVSLCGLLTTFDAMVERDISPNARGYVVKVLPRQESCYSVVFPTSDVRIFLSKAELRSGDYRLEGPLEVGDIVGTVEHGDAENTLLRWNGRAAVDSGDSTFDAVCADTGLSARTKEWLALDADGMPLKDPIDAENDAHARRVDRHGR